MSDRSVMKARFILQFMIVSSCLLQLAPLPAWSAWLISGEFDAYSPRYDRVKGTVHDSPQQCSEPSDDSYNDNVVYFVYHLVAPAGGLLQADIGSGSSVDTMMALYCDPFDPEKPSANLVAMDDDGNGYPHAGLTSRSLTLAPGEPYHLVVSSYSDYGETGSFILSLGDNVEHIHNLQDVIVTLRVLGGLAPPISRLSRVSDILTDGKISLATGIIAMKEVNSGL